MLADASLAKTIYWLFYVLGFLTIFVLNWFYAKKYRLASAKALLFTVSSYALIYLWAYVLAWIESGFQKWGSHNAVRVYIWMPVILCILGKPFRIDKKTACDFIAPSTCVVYGIARLGCLFPGCCYGIPVKWGIFSYQAGGRVFPVQLCEALSAILIALFCFHCNRRDNYQSSGKTYPKMMILYGSSRFIWEFFAVNKKIFLGCSSLALHALLMVLVAGSWLIYSVEAENKRKEQKKCQKKR